MQFGIETSSNPLPPTDLKNRPYPMMTGCCQGAQPAYRISLQTAKRRATKAPVETGVTEAAAAWDEVLEAPDAEAEEVWLAVAVALAVPESDAEELTPLGYLSAVALRVGHCSLAVQAVCADKSFGLSATHWS